MNNQRGKRAGKKHHKQHDNGLKVRVNTSIISTAKLVEDAGKYWECSDTTEDVSLTTKLHLRLFPDTRSLLYRGNPFNKPVKVVRETRNHRRVEVD